MRGGSIKTLVKDRHTAGDQLDLRMGNGAVLVGEIAHPSAWQILRLDQLKPGIGFLRHERERAPNVGQNAPQYAASVRSSGVSNSPSRSFGWIMGTQASPR